MGKNLTLLLFLLIFFIIYNILLMKFLPTPKKEEEKKEIKEEVKAVLPFLKIKEDEEIRIENEKLEIIFSERGGFIKKVILKNYKHNKGEILSIPLYNLLSTFDTLLNLKEIKENLVIFSSEDGKIRKEYEVLEGYKIKVKFENLGEVLFSTLPYIDRDDKNDYRLIEYVRGKIKKHELKDFLKIDYAGENALWLGSETKYFVSVIIKPSYFGKIIKGEEYKEGKFFKLLPELKDSFYLYIGPKDYFVLKKEGFALENLYPMGFSLFKPFTLFVLYSFKWGYEILKHFSLVIFIFTLLMKIVFLPLSFKSFKAMKKMEELKPRLEALKKAYKNDPKKLNEETLKLYKEMGVNPFSGCLPLLLQLPIFWALYQVLRYDIIFRGRELFLWIKDLSYKDPFYVLPVLMGLTSLLQQFLQPSQDPQARRIGFFMAVFITIIFLNFPSGLVYYWLLYNIFGIFETFLIKRKMQR